MLTEMFAFIDLDMNVVQLYGSCPHDTESLLKTKQMAKNTLKVKMNSTSLEAIKIIVPWTYLHKCKM